MNVRFRPGRKLLVASLGVAAISYVACGTQLTSGNLAPPPSDGGKDAVGDAIDEMISGNLAPPPDAGPDAADASTTDAGDAGTKTDGGIIVVDGGPQKDGGQ